MVEDRGTTTLASRSESSALVKSVASSTPARKEVGGGVATTLGTVARHGPLAGVGLVVVWAGVPLAAWAWFVASRFLYVGFVGYSLLKQATVESPVAAETTWRRFRGRASAIMLSDSIAFGALCIVTRGTLALPGPAWWAWVVGLALTVLGVGVKFWASASLPDGTFFWRDFFVPAEERNFSRRGPYRWISNPMYSVGYAHAYGFALLLGSLSGLVASVFSQAAVLLLAFLVERPHVRRVQQARQRDHAASA